MQESVMKPIIIILVLLLVGLAYIGAVQVVRLIRERYRKVKERWRQIRTILHGIDGGKVVIQVKTQSPSAQIRTPPKPEIKEMGSPEPVEDKKPIQAVEPGEIPQDETLLVSIEVDGGEYALSEEVSAGELAQVCRTLSAKTAPIEDEIAAAKTLGKVMNSPLMDAFMGVTGDRVREMLSNVMNKDPEIIKKGFDYSGYIK